jgi:hypothetical protein
MDAPVCVSVDHTSVTVAWKEVAGAVSYELQIAMPAPTSGSAVEAAPIKKKEEEEEGEWTSLSSSCMFGLIGVPSSRRKALILIDPAHTMARLFSEADNC